MSPVCFACQHANPPDAKFCNECGCPCSLKPCAQCDAINDAGADECKRCGADFRDTKTCATARSEVARSTESSRDEVVGAGKARGRFIPDAISVDHFDTSTFADLTLPPDIAQSANVDFLIFPTSGTRGLESKRLDGRPAVALAPDDAGADNVDFSLFPAARVTNLGIKEKEVDALPPDSASARSRRRPKILALALLSVVCVAGFYGARYRYPFEESPDRLSQGAMTIGASTVESSPGPPSSSESAKLVPGADGKVDATAANDSLPTVIDAMEAEPTSMAQRGIANEVLNHGATVSARDVSKSVTSGVRGTDKARLPRSLAAAGSASAVSQKRVSEPSQQRSEGCADGVAALGLCDVTSGR